MVISCGDVRSEIARQEKGWRKSGERDLGRENSSHGGRYTVRVWDESNGGKVLKN